MLSNIADRVVRGVEGVGETLSETLFDSVLRLGVTGLSRSGKTVFITSLVANLLDRGRMPQLSAAASGAIRAAYLRPQPDDTVPRFDYERHLAALTGDEPYWPEGTRAVSELRLSLRVQPGGLLGAVSGPRTLHLDIVDYPGEWLLDLALMEQNYDDWARAALDKARRRPEGARFAALAQATDGAAPLQETTLRELADTYTAYLHAAQEAGHADGTPGRFLLPGEMLGSPVLTFAPLPEPAAGARGDRGSLRREMARRFEAYKAQVIKPFFRDHFARIDRQVVLVDALGAIHRGPEAVEDMREAMEAILRAFRPGRNSWLSPLLGRRVEKILFAATKADHLHHSQHGRLAAIMAALVDDARRRADFAGAETQAMAIAALRTTVEQTLEHDGRPLDCVEGRLAETGRRAAFYPGELPEDPARILAPARERRETWLDGDYGTMRFAPAAQSLRAGEGPPHIRMDRAAEFLLGDWLK